MKPCHGRAKTASGCQVSGPPHAESVLDSTDALFKELESADQACGFRPEFLFGTLADDMRRVQSMIDKRSREISKFEQSREHEVDCEVLSLSSPEQMFETIDNLYDLHGSSSSIASEALAVSLKSFKATLLKVSEALPQLDVATKPPEIKPSQRRQGQITEEHVELITSSLQELRELEASRSVGKEVSAFANLLEFRLRQALTIATGDRAKNRLSARDMNAAWCQRTLQTLKLRRGDVKRPAKARLLRWACEPCLVHHSLRQLVKPWTHKALPKSPGHQSQGAVFRRVPSAPAKRSPLDRLELGAAAAEAWVYCADRHEFSQQVPAKVAGASS